MNSRRAAEVEGGRTREGGHKQNEIAELLFLEVKAYENGRSRGEGEK